MSLKVLRFTQHYLSIDLVERIKLLREHLFQLDETNSEKVKLENIISSL